MEIDPALVERMVALVRSIARASATTEPVGSDWIEAHAIVAELPKPVDPDLVAARELATEFTGGQARWSGIMQGKHDDSPAVKHLLAAVRRGRELAKEQGL